MIEVVNKPVNLIYFIVNNIRYSKKYTNIWALVFSIPVSAGQAARSLLLIY